jgi:outer membrane receptor protein involved in Fe transport
MVETVTVTSSKLGTTDVQSIPIAITELSAEQLTAQKIEGGPDLLHSVPNMTFTKTNFTGYNISIRGIGTQAISATSDPGVAVAFNEAGLIHNRLFEQEFFDVASVEVLRGPQGTLYGRNATGGVVNITSAKPKLDRFEGSIKGEVGNYDSKRLVGMLNVPILDDMLAVRVAGSLTKRDGYDYNSTTKNRINGRDLWSLRTTVGFEPVPWLRSNVVWERFREKDDRSRTGKQLCHRDDGPTMIGDTSLIAANDPFGQNPIVQANFSQGCKPGSLYDDAAFGTPNGLAIPFILAPLDLQGIASGIGFTQPQYTNGATRRAVTFLEQKDPYGGLMQSRDLRTVASVRDPVYRAKADVLQLNLEADLSDALTFVSQTSYNQDDVYSLQDYNRFNSVPIFRDTSLLTSRYYQPQANPRLPSEWAALSPRPEGSPVGTPGVFCDPQIGCTDTIAGIDISMAQSKQFSQEFRLQSDFAGPLNFSVGGNYTRFKTENDYYVMYNVMTAIAMTPPLVDGAAVGAVYQPGSCPTGPFNSLTTGPIPTDNSGCVYVDPNPVESINGEGHNYFRSRNPYKLTSQALFGEVYWNPSDTVKVTAGLRYTDDSKTFIPVPSQALLAPSQFGGGLVSRGYPEKPAIRQTWREFTGRFGVDWKPDLGFTDDTLLYAFYSRGYKAGGMNPPTPGFATREEYIAGALAAGVPEATVNLFDAFGYYPILELTAVDYGATFKPEYVNSFEIGAKNSFLNGALILNATAFYYDYKDYQVSQIKDRTAVNENFDAKVWGTEFEAVYSPFHNFRLNANLGYLKTRIANGETSIDIMNRTQGDPNYTLVKPWLQLPSNCVVPTAVAEQWAATTFNRLSAFGLCGGARGSAKILISGVAYTDPATGAAYDYNNYPELNGGAGLRADLSGNELPNSPNWTLNFGAQYTIPFADEWAATVRTDLYWQAQSWWRVYNADPYDRLNAWSNVNFTIHIDAPNGLAIEAYVKNAFDNTALTGAFLNSDDSGLTTNVFTTDPRLIGFSITKTF